MDKRMIFVVFALSLLSSGFGDNFFPIGAYHVDTTRMCQVDSAGFNTVQGLVKTGFEQVYVDSAAAHSLKAIVEHYSQSTQRNLWTYTHIQHVVYESDTDHGLLPFVHATGQSVYDPDATGGSTAWWCAEEAHDSGVMQYAGWSVFENQPGLYQYEDDLQYTASFRLKMANPNSSDIFPLCSLYVDKRHGWPPNVDTFIHLADTIVRFNSFVQPHSYDYFELKFNRDKADTGFHYQYGAYWYGRDTIWLDHVRLKDQRWDSLTFHRAYDQDLEAVVGSYVNNQALFRWYLADEPWWNVFGSNRYVTNFLRDFGAQAGAAPVCAMDRLGAYVDSVNPEHVWVNMYPLMGGGYEGGRTPEDTGRAFQAQLDNALCAKLGVARGVAKSAGIPLWFTPQAFGDSIPGETLPGYKWEKTWREPTPRELSCMVWLGLAYGAKGIIYYHYPVSWERDHWVLGLVNRDGSPRGPKWAVVCSLNADLSRVASVLLGVSSDTVFRSDDIPESSWINAVSDPLVQIGLFHDAEGGQYSIMVNRHCGVHDTLLVTVGTTSVEKQHSLKDMLTGEEYTTKVGTFRPIQLLPGGGRLFKLR
ncbi:MAG: hypothetical protein AM326_06170 [Candidatus Thorarchaeota archaeon SMTZ-45]|nr:MAG: hypothetical protein AM326_06170 [Candidatus Thorarchaeota archaeon SMTZ-45]